jgi:hypothetical protein
MEHRHVLQTQIGRRGLRPRVGDGGARAIALRGSVRGRLCGDACAGTPAGLAGIATCVLFVRDGGEMCVRFVREGAEERGGERGGERWGGRERGREGGGEGPPSSSSPMMLYCAGGGAPAPPTPATPWTSGPEARAGVSRASGRAQLTGPFRRTKTLGGVRQSCRASVPPPLPPVQSGHVSSIPPYYLDTSEPRAAPRGRHA